MDSKEKADLIADAAPERRAENVLVQDMRGISDICNYFVICDGSSTRRVSAIADGISEELDKYNKAPFHVEGKREKPYGSCWITGM
ncbi:MAG: RsfS/YbeB/iojap family protein [Candidatus Omnitrophica bacterium]|nr:RsfS/YbeB/iojap family protein [Candidatus Omnitrophota bacterium]